MNVTYIFVCGFYLLNIGFYIILNAIVSKIGVMHSLRHILQWKMIGFAIISLKCFLSSSFVFVNNHIVFIIVIRVDVYHVINTTIAKMCTIKVVKLP